MDIPIELIITTLITPILGAIATLFWLLNREKNARLEDRDKAIGRMEERLKFYEEQLIPTERATQEALRNMAEILERRHAELFPGERGGE